jgi:hypothetical protein
LFVFVRCHKQNVPFPPGIVEEDLRKASSGTLSTAS